MPGPNSAPNGDKSLTTNEAFACTLHGRNFDKCISVKAKALENGKELPKCKNIRKREYLLQHNRLFTEKSQISK